MESLAKIRKENGYSQQDLADYLGVTRQAYCNYEKGKREPSIWTLEKIAAFYNVSIESLLNEKGARPASVGTVSIPVLGSVPAGIPIDVIEDVIDWEEIPKRMTYGDKKYFGLKVKGDSMYPKYLDGDTVIVRQQPTFDTGDDCVVYVNGYNATLKKLIKGEDGSITLRPINPEYPPKTYEAEEVSILSIAGVVIELRRKTK